MSQFSKIIASVLVLLALAIAGFAIFLMAKPDPTPPAAAIAPISEAAPAPKPAPQQTYAVVVAKNAIPAGQRFTTENLAIAQRTTPPTAGYTQMEDLLGEAARISIAKDSAIQPDWLKKGLAAYLESGERAISIPISPVSAGVSRIRPNDTVDVFFTLSRKSGEVLSSQSRLLLSKMRVLALGNHSVDGPLAEEEANAANNSTAVLAVSVADINALLLASKEGTLQLVLRSAEDESVPDVALFPERPTILAGKADLSEDELELLNHPDNKAFAGDSLVQFGGPAAETPLNPKQEEEKEKMESSQQRTVEIIRGRSKQLEAY